MHEWAVTRIEAWKVHAGDLQAVLSLKTNSAVQSRPETLLVSSGRHGRLWDPAQGHAETCLRLTLCHCAIKCFLNWYNILMGIYHYLLELGRPPSWFADT